MKRKSLLICTLSAAILCPALSCATLQAAPVPVDKWQETLVARCDGIQPPASARPAKKERLFRSDAVENKIKEIKKLLTNPYLA